ncbi:LOW QUALITY PROTEIN: hypothetical protein TorRG33x02_003510, partial [Trema orientale]
KSPIKIVLRNSTNSSKEEDKNGCCPPLKNFSRCLEVEIGASRSVARRFKTIGISRRRRYQQQEEVLAVEEALMKEEVSTVEVRVEEVLVVSLS